MPNLTDKKLRDGTAAIIAGGKSSRFGEPKALARFQSRELIDYAIDLASSISHHQILVYGDENIFAKKNIECIPDLIPKCGPLGGIYTALTHAATSWIATLPCDMPYLAPEVYETLALHRSQNRPIVAVSHKGVESIVSIWPRSLAGRIEDALREGKLAIHTVLGEFHAVETVLPEVMPNYQETWFLNINKLEDLQ
ncbi:MAG: molybdenum cofactor guanylyltransferase [bacterium]